MEDFVETHIGALPTHLVANPDVLKKLIVDEIERSLPRIILALNVQQPDDHTIHLLRYRLTTGRGFRPLTSAQRKQSVTQLKNETYLKSLRHVQEHATATSTSNTSGGFVSPDDFPSGETSTEFYRRLRMVQDLPEIRALGRREMEKWVSGSFTPFTLTRHLSTIAQEHTNPKIVEGVTSVTAPAIEQQEAVLNISDKPIELQEPIAQRNIRGLVALLKNGRLLTFVEPDTKDLIAKDLEAIEVPEKKVYEALNIEMLMSEFHDLVANDTVTRSTELRLLDALIMSLENEAQWSRINKRRFHLITKKHSLGLDPAENNELEELQQLADMQANAAQPLPFSELAMLRDYAHKMGFFESPFAS